jgi:hypothetical protein
MFKLQIFVIANICKPKFVTFGRLGTWARFLKNGAHAAWPKLGRSDTETIFYILRKRTSLDRASSYATTPLFLEHKLLMPSIAATSFGGNTFKQNSRFLA